MWFWLLQMRLLLKCTLSNSVVCPQVLLPGPPEVQHWCCHQAERAEQLNAFGLNLTQKPNWGVEEQGKSGLKDKFYTCCWLWHASIMVFHWKHYACHRAVRPPPLLRQRLRMMIALQDPNCFRLHGDTVIVGFTEKGCHAVKRDMRKS